MVKIIAYILLFLIVATCNKPDEFAICNENFNKPVSADFMIGTFAKEANGIIPEKFIESDTLYYDSDSFQDDCDNFRLSSTAITFKAKDTLTENYIWKVGTDDKFFNTKSVTLLFDEVENLRIPVTLIVSKARTPCFAYRKDKDTITKYMTLLKWKNHPLAGRYFGYHEGNPMDTATFEIKKTNYNETFAPFFDRGFNCQYSINNITFKKNIHELIERTRAIVRVPMYFKGNAFFSKGSIGRDGGICYLDKNTGKIIYEYYYWELSLVLGKGLNGYDTKSIPIIKKFIGTKIN